jgi:hypothetical protein
MTICGGADGACAPTGSWFRKDGAAPAVEVPVVVENEG